MQLKRRLIHPLRMNREHNRLANRLKHAHTETTNLSTTRSYNPQQLLPKLQIPPRSRFKLDQKMNGQAAPPKRQDYTPHFLVDNLHNI